MVLPDALTTPTYNWEKLDHVPPTEDTPIDPVESAWTVALVGAKRENTTSDFGRGPGKIHEDNSNAAYYSKWPVDSGHLPSSGMLCKWPTGMVPGDTFPKECDSGIVVMIVPGTANGV